MTLSRYVTLCRIKLGGIEFPFDTPIALSPEIANPLLTTKSIAPQAGVIPAMPTVAGDVVRDVIDLATGKKVGGAVTYTTPSGGEVGRFDKVMGPLTQNEYEAIVPHDVSTAYFVSTVGIYVGDTLIADAGGTGGTGITNLSATTTASTVTVVSSSGADATIPAATTSSAGVATAAQIVKINGIATGATANATDAQLRDRSTHTGTQVISTVSGLQLALDAKQDQLISGENIKTVNGNSLIGSGNLTLTESAFENVSGVTYNAQDKVTAYSVGNVSYTVTYPSTTSIVVTGNGKTTTITLDDSGRIVGTAQV